MVCTIRPRLLREAMSSRFQGWIFETCAVQHHDRCRQHHGQRAVKRWCGDGAGDREYGRSSAQNRECRAEHHTGSRDIAGASGGRAGLGALHDSAARARRARLAVHRAQQILGQVASINGNLPFSTILADGAAVTLPSSANADVMVLETIQEVKISSSAFSAQYGVGGIMFNQISKGGTNSLPRRGLRVFSEYCAERGILCLREQERFQFFTTTTSVVPLADPF